MLLTKKKKKKKMRHETEEYKLTNTLDFNSLKAFISIETI